MGEKKEKKEMSKGMRIFVIVLLSILCIYLLLGLIFTAKDGLSKGGTPVLISICLILVLDIFCGYGVIKNISKLRGKDKQELTAEQLQKRKKKQKNILIAISVIIVGAIIGISLSNIFDGSYTNNTNIQKETLDQYAGTWNRTSSSMGYKTMLILDGKGNFTEKTVDRQGNTTISSSGTYKIENDTITLNYENSSVKNYLKIKNANTLDILNSQGKPTYMQYKR